MQPLTIPFGAAASRSVTDPALAEFLRDEFPAGDGPGRIGSSLEPEQAQGSWVRRLVDALHRGERPLMAPLSTRSR